MDGIQYACHDFTFNNSITVQEMTLQDYSAELKFRVTWLLSEPRLESNIILMFIGFLLAIGFAIGDVSNNTNYVLINAFAKQDVWSILFAFYGIVKLFAFIWNIPKTLTTVNSVIGVWAFNYIFLSFVVFDTTTIAPTELLLLVPTLLEFWVMISTNKNKRINYG